MQFYQYYEPKAAHENEQIEPVDVLTAWNHSWIIQTRLRHNSEQRTPFRGPPPGEELLCANQACREHITNVNDHACIIDQRRRRGPGERELLDIFNYCSLNCARCKRMEEDKEDPSLRFNHVHLPLYVFIQNTAGFWLTSPLLNYQRH